MELSKKLQLKSGQTCKIINKPKDLVLADLKNSRVSLYKTDAVLCFVRSISELELWVNEHLKSLSDDCLVWFAYPKKSSPLYKKFKCDINRDNGWECLRDHVYRPIRSIAVDSDWTALRFKPQHLVKAISPRFRI